jgi:hypothetical protein
MSEDTTLQVPVERLATSLTSSARRQPPGRSIPAHGPRHRELVRLARLFVPFLGHDSPCRFAAATMENAKIERERDTRDGGTPRHEGSLTVILGR